MNVLMEISWILSSLVLTSIPPVNRKSELIQRNYSNQRQPLPPNPTNPEIVHAQTLTLLFKSQQGWFIQLTVLKL